MKTLIFLPNYIGDILMTTPAIRILKLFMPENKICCVVTSKYRELLEDNPNIYKIIEKTQRLSLINKLYKEKFDVTILFRTTFYNSLLTFFSNSKYSVGLKEEFSNFFIKKTFIKDFARPYRGECLMLVEEVLKYFNINYKVDTNELKKLDFYGWDKIEIKSLVEKIFVENNISISKPLIVINPLSTRETKNLTIEQYVSFIKLLKEKFKDKYEIILVGSKDDICFTTKISESTNVKNLSGKLSLKMLGYLLSKTKVFVSPDTGPAFIAQAVNCKTVIIFTSTSPDKYAPYNENVKYYYLPLKCSPCYKNYCFAEEKNKCILQIKVEDIIDLVNQML